jgi:Fic family protein
MLQYPLKPSQTDLQPLVVKLLGLAEAVTRLPVTSEGKQKVFHQQLLKSALFSARIEGNDLTLATSQHLDLNDPQEKQTVELSNAVKALQLSQQFSPPLTQQQLLQLHAQVMADLHWQAGTFRTESSAIYDQLGNIVYLTPEPAEMKQMLQVLLTEINRTHSTPTEQLVAVVCCHYYFEKIHPFLDGNGRVGRVLMQWQLARTQLFAPHPLPIEEYLDAHKKEYYFYLEKNTRRLQPCITFFLEGLIWAAEKLLEDLTQTIESNQDNDPVAKTVEQLLPRRQEIYHLVADHPHCSLNFIHRRFYGLSRRTIQQDVKVLVDKKLIVRHGKTRGVRYSVR